MSAVAALTLAVVFALAAVSKLRERGRFRATLERVLPMRLAAPASVVIPGAEFMLALALAGGVAPRVAAAATVTALIGFTVVLLLRRGVLADCGCFGSQRGGLSPVAAAGRNALLTALALMVAVDPGGARLWSSDPPDLVGAWLVVVGLLCTTVCAHAAWSQRRWIGIGPR